MKLRTLYEKILVVFCSFTVFFGVNFAKANVVHTDVPLDYIPNINETKTYTDNQGNVYTFRLRMKNGDMFDTYVTKNGVVLPWTGYQDWNYALNGKPRAEGWGRSILNFDENGNFLGVLGENTTVTTDDGKILQYNSQGKLQKAYNDIFDCLAQRYISASAVNLDIRDEDGNYYARDSKGNIVDIYYQDGKVEKGKYAYKYDSGGNIISAYKDGISIYKKTIYTMEEAAAAVRQGRNNVVSITFK